MIDAVTYEDNGITWVVSDCEMCRHREDYPVRSFCKLNGMSVKGKKIPKTCPLRGKNDGNKGD